MMLALIPLFVRMILIHFVLIYGTNNVNTTDHEYTPLQLYQKSIGARLVLPARIFYALFIWTSKLTVSEFLKRITFRIWRTTHQRTLQGIRAFLFITFGAVVVATLAECQPFHHYWQVVPDPGPHCRQGFAQLLVMGTCDVVTDILLIAFPIPVVLTSGVNWKRKLQMVLLFSLSAIMIGVTAARMPEVISKHGRQQYRTVWASCEILAATAVSNAVILGSMLRDKGTKKNKFRSYSFADSVDRSSGRRPTLVRYQTTESDEDLFFELGCRVPEHLRTETVSSPRPAPPALPAAKDPVKPAKRDDTPISERIRMHDSSSEESLKLPPQQMPAHQAQSPPAPNRTPSVNLFDVGNLLEDHQMSGASQPRGPHTTGIMGDIVTKDFAAGRMGETGSRSGSRAFLRDVGGILSPGLVGNSSGSPRRNRELHRGSDRARPPPVGVLGPMIERHDTQVSLQDPGGLLQNVQTPYASGAITQKGSGDEWHGSERYDTGAAGRQTIRESIELEDLTEMLREGRRPDPSIMGPSRSREPIQHNATRLAVPPRDGRQAGFDDLVLNDAGGLIQR